METYSNLKKRVNLRDLTLICGFIDLVFGIYYASEVVINPVEDKATEVIAIISIAIIIVAAVTLIIGVQNVSKVIVNIGNIFLFVILQQNHSFIS